MVSRLQRWRQSNSEQLDLHRQGIADIVSMERVKDAAVEQLAVARLDSTKLELANNRLAFTGWTLNQRKKL